MIFKRFILGDQDNLPELLKVGSGGIDTGCLQKSASNSSEKLDSLDIEPEDGHAYIHLITTGAGEYYGCFFRGEKVLTEYGSVNIEDIEKGDLVWTHNNRLRPVTEVFCSPYKGWTTEISIQNLPEPQISTLKHPFLVLDKETMDRKRIKYYKQYIDRETFLKSLSIEDAVYKPADEIKKGDYVFHPFELNNNEVERFSKDFAFIAGLYAAEGCLSKRYGRGGGDNWNKVIFVMNKYNDRKALDKLEEICSSYGHSLYVKDTVRTPNAVRVEVFWKDLAGDLLYYIGKGSHDKYIHSDLLAQDSGWKKEFIASYLDGDGHITEDSENDRYKGVVKFSTVSKDLAYGLQKMMASVGAVCSISKCTNRADQCTYSKVDSPIYSGGVGKLSAANFINFGTRLNYNDEFCQGFARSGSYIISEGYMLHRVKKIDHNYVEDVYKYNLEVEEDNSYVTDIIGHNSNANSDFFPEDRCTVHFPLAEKEASMELEGGLRNYHCTYNDYGGVYHNHRNSKKGYGSQGEIVKEWYNPDMHRGELIIKVAEDLKDPETGESVWHDTIEKLAQDKPVLFSQGCFTAGTLITMADCSKKLIEEISPGEEVLSHTGSIVSVDSLRTIYPDDKRELCIVNISGCREITCTPDHPFFVINKDGFNADTDILKEGMWIEAQDLNTDCYAVSLSDDAGADDCNLIKAGDFILRKVESNRNIVSDAPVFNLEVNSEDHSYIANNVAVHNCSVPYDVASCCGRIAKTANEHCDHFKKNKLEFLKNGKQIYVYNNQPYFHDISEVDKPADRIAMALQKVASDGQDPDLQKESQPEGLYVPYDLVEKLGTGDQQDRHLLLTKLSEIEKRVPMIADSVKSSLGCSMDIPEEDEERVTENLKDIPEEFLLDKLKKHNMMLTPGTFCVILLKKQPSDIPGFKNIRKVLKNIFTEFKENKDPNEILSDGSYRPIAPLRLPGGEDRVKKLSGLLSLDPEPLQDRVIRISVRNRDKDKCKEEGSDKTAAEVSPELEKVAEEYAKYQLAFLASGSKDNNKLLLTVLNNQENL